MIRHKNRYFWTTISSWFLKRPFYGRNWYWWRERLAPTHDTTPLSFCRPLKKQDTSPLLPIPFHAALPAGCTPPQGPPVPTHPPRCWNSWGGWVSLGHSSPCPKLCTQVHTYLRYNPLSLPVVFKKPGQVWTNPVSYQLLYSLLPIQWVIGLLYIQEDLE